jgi:hypothetical protein
MLDFSALVGYNRSKIQRYYAGTQGRMTVLRFQDGGLIMNIKIIDDIAVIDSSAPLITDVQSALDLIASIGFEHNITKIVIGKAAFSEDFFRLSSGLAGEVVQKFVTYGFRVAIVGDFSGYTSKPLRSYIYECNTGRHLNFAADEDEAIRKLTE